MRCHAVFRQGAWLCAGLLCLACRSNPKGASGSTDSEVSPDTGESTRGTGASDSEIGFPPGKEDTGSPVPSDTGTEGNRTDTATATAEGMDSDTDTGSPAPHPSDADSGTFTEPDAGLDAGTGTDSVAIKNDAGVVTDPEDTATQPEMVDTDTEVEPPAFEEIPKAIDVPDAVTLTDDVQRLYNCSVDLTPEALEPYFTAFFYWAENLHTFLWYTARQWLDDNRIVECAPQGESNVCYEADYNREDGVQVSYRLEGKFEVMEDPGIGTFTRRDFIETLEVVLPPGRASWERISLSDTNGMGLGPGAERLDVSNDMSWSGRVDPLLPESSSVSSKKDYSWDSEPNYDYWDQIEVETSTCSSRRTIWGEYLCSPSMAPHIETVCFGDRPCAQLQSCDRLVVRSEPEDLVCYDLDYPTWDVVGSCDDDAQFYEDFVLP